MAIGGAVANSLTNFGSQGGLAVVIGKGSGSIDGALTPKRALCGSLGDCWGTVECTHMGY